MSSNLCRDAAGIIAPYLDIILETTSGDTTLTLVKFLLTHEATCSHSASQSRCCMCIALTVGASSEIFSYFVRMSLVASGSPNGLPATSSSSAMNGFAFGEVGDERGNCCPGKALVAEPSIDSVAFKVCVVSASRLPIGSWRRSDNWSSSNGLPPSIDSPSHSCIISASNLYQPGSNCRTARPLFQFWTQPVGW